MGIIGAALASFHIWSTVIAYQEMGVIASILTFIFILISDAFWVLYTFGDNESYTYAYVCVSTSYMIYSMYISNFVKK